MTTALARRFKVDVSPDASTWTPLLGITDLAPGASPTLADANDYDTNGWGSQEKVLQAWSLVAKCNRKTNAGVFDPGQELCRARQFKFDEEARLYVRRYDRNGAPEAYQGRGIVQFEQSKTGVTDLEEVTITFTGDGVLDDTITNPALSSAVPALISATPSAVAATGIVEITGSGFANVTGATGVKIGGTNATSYIVVSDNVIVAVMPAGSAGSAPIVVTNGAGASNSLPYTRGA